MHWHLHTSALNPLGTAPHNHVVTARAETSERYLILLQNGTGQDSPKHPIVAVQQDFDVCQYVSRGGKPKKEKKN